MKTRAHKLLIVLLTTMLIAACSVSEPTSTQPLVQETVSEEETCIQGVEVYELPYREDDEAVEIWTDDPSESGEPFIASGDAEYLYYYDCNGEIHVSYFTIKNGEISLEDGPFSEITKDIVLLDGRLVIAKLESGSVIFSSIATWRCSLALTYSDDEDWNSDLYYFFEETEEGDYEQIAFPGQRVLYEIDQLATIEYDLRCGEEVIEESFTVNGSTSPLSTQQITTEDGDFVYAEILSNEDAEQLAQERGTGFRPQNTIILLYIVPQEFEPQAPDEFEVNHSELITN